MPVSSLLVRARCLEACYAEVSKLLEHCPGLFTCTEKYCCCPTGSASQGWGLFTARMIQLVLSADISGARISFILLSCCMLLDIHAVWGLLKLCGLFWWLKRFNRWLKRSSQRWRHTYTQNKGNIFTSFVLSNEGLQFFSVLYNWKLNLWGLKCLSGKIIYFFLTIWIKKIKRKKAFLKT